MATNSTFSFCYKHDYSVYSIGSADTTAQLWQLPLEEVLTDSECFHGTPVQTLQVLRQPMSQLVST